MIDTISNHEYLVVQAAMLDSSAYSCS